MATLLNGDDKVDYLLNNAGVNVASQQTSLTVSPAAIMENVQTNVVGPAMIVQALEKHLKTGTVVMNMTSGLGSMDDAGKAEVAKCTPYSISKAGVNMLTLHQASELRGRGVVVVCVDPGVSYSVSGLFMSWGSVLTGFCVVGEDGLYERSLPPFL